MANNLDKINFSKNDPDNMIGLLEDFSELCRDAWHISQDFVLPSYYIKANKFVIVGMGSSGISGDIIRDLLFNEDSIIYTSHDYLLPGWVDKDTLVIICSYSGNTEESLSAFLDAIKKGAKIVAVTSGGKLESLSSKYKIPIFKFNLSCAPRNAFPYLFTLTLSIFIRLGILTISDKEFDQAIEFVEKHRDRFKKDTRVENNLAKLLARKIFDKFPVIYASGILSSVGQRFKTQINENAKSFASLELFPELNHNAVEGYSHPKDNHFIVSLESNFDSEGTIRRQNITARIVAKKRIPIERVKFVPCVSQLAEILTMVMFGNYVSYYLGYLYNEKISKNEVIDILKSEMIK